MSGMLSEARVVILVGTLQALIRGYYVFFFLLLPVLLATDILSAEQLGYIGALLVVGVIAGASLVTHKLHSWSKKVLLYIVLSLFFVASILLFWPENLTFLVVSFLAVGFANGIGMSTIGALAAQLTAQGQRFKTFAKISMMVDVMRIVYPLIASVIFLAAGFVGLVCFALATVVILLVILLSIQGVLPVENEPKRDEEPSTSIRSNRAFWHALWIEFVDSVASSQLFVFLPALLTLKNFTIEYALVMQSAVFLGYLSGRWVVGSLAHAVSGYKAVGIAEIGMIVTIMLLIVFPPSVWVYVLCFLLGVFSRGTAPVIKAIAFDTLAESQTRRGSAVFVTIGEVGSAAAQLSFGFLLAWFGANAPFVVSAFFAGIAALVCFSPRAR